MPKQNINSKWKEEFYLIPVESRKEILSKLELLVELYKKNCIKK